MPYVAEPVARVAEALSRLPGIGPKSAQRLVYYLLQNPDGEAMALAQAIRDLKEKVTLCSVCFNITDVDPCRICTDEKRDHSVICVVERPSDVVPLERTGKYAGVYHVLHGTISPAQGIGPDELKVKELLSRVRECGVREVVVATNLDVEGETTAMYLRRALESVGIRVSRLARGLPYGAELEYADDVTLGQAIEGRQAF